MLLFGSESWNLTPVLLMWLEGFYIRCGYRMIWMHTQKCGPTNTWVYPALSGVLMECGLQTIEEYIQHWRQSIVVWVVDRLLFAACWEGEQM